MYPAHKAYNLRFKTLKGLTMIELLVAAMLFSVIMVSSALLLSVGLKEWSVEQNRINLRQESMPAMETMVRYIGMAGNYPLLTGGITSATATSMTFYADPDNNGVLETVTISYASNKVTCTIVGTGTTTVTLAPYVTSFSFAYYNSAGALLAVPVTPQSSLDSIRIVTITMTMTSGNDSITFNSSAYCRNNHT